jgi:hypothetical protein
VILGSENDSLEYNASKKGSSHLDVMITSVTRNNLNDFLPFCWHRMRKEGTESDIREKHTVLWNQAK